MKTKVKNWEAREYPCLKLSREDGIIVLFSAPKTGMVVCNNGNYQTGYYSTSWAENDLFILFAGTLELSNN